MESTQIVENQELSPNTIGEMAVEDIVAMIRRQVEFYLSQENLPNDSYLISQLDTEGYVSIETIFQFNKVNKLHQGNLQLLLDAIKSSETLAMNSTNTKVKPKYLDENKTRCTIILREIPSSTPEADIKNIFSGSNLEIVDVRPDIGDIWFIRFACNDDAQKGFEFLSDKQFNGKNIKGRIKNGSVIDILTASMKRPQPAAGQENATAVNPFIPHKDFPKKEGTNNFVPPYQPYYNKQFDRKNNRKPFYPQNQDYQNDDQNSKPFRKPFNKNYNNNYNNNYQDRRNNMNKRMPKKPKKPVPDFDQSAFPPLPAVEKTGGYEGNFLHYTKAQVIGVFQKTVGEVADAEIHKPQNWEKFVDVIAATQAPNKTLEMTKPLPKLSSHSIIQFAPEKPMKKEGEEKKVEDIEQPSIMVEDEPTRFTSFAEAAVTTKDIALNEKAAKGSHKLEIQVQKKDKKTEKKEVAPAENAQAEHAGKQSQKGGKPFKGERKFDNKKGFPKREKSYREKQTSEAKNQPQEQHSAEEIKTQEQSQQPQEPQVEISYASVAEKKEKSE